MQDFCYSCGRKLNGDELRCPECGALTELGRQSTPAQQQASYAAGRGRQGSIGGVSWSTILAFTAIVVVIAVGGVMLLSSPQEPAQTDKTLTYNWTFTDSNGDHNCTCTLIVKDADYKSMMKSTITRSGSTSSDRYTRDDNTVVFAVKDYIVVDDYIKTMKTLLKTEYDKIYPTPTSSDPEFATFIVTFVQKCITYDSDEANSGSDYWRFPLETLVDKKGDCEDTSILTAALLDAAGYNAGIFLLPEHAMGSVKKDGEGGVKPIYTNEKVGYYPIETTYDTQKNIGVMDEKYLGAFFHNYTGYVDKYYGV